MRVLILGGDGYLGWPTAMRFAAHGHEVVVVDNYLRRDLAKATASEALLTTPKLPERVKIFEQQSGKAIKVIIADCTDAMALNNIFTTAFNGAAPETVIHYAEQPSGPYSMRGFTEAQTTFNNNLQSTFNLIWAVIQHAPDCHIIKLGTMGEYGTPNIDIEEGWINIEHKGRQDKFLFPRQAGTLYHTTKVLDTDLLWFYVRTYGLRVTDLMQGPVYGLITDESSNDDRLLPNFHYDDIFGTVLNRFLVQAVAGIPLTVYGSGGQTRGYLNIKDTLQCVALAATQPAPHSSLRVLNQFTEQFSVNQLAEKISRVGKQLGLKVSIQTIPNPRKELETHYYNAAHQGLIEMGLVPNLLTEATVVGMLTIIEKHKALIDTSKIMPRVTWR
jgi:UDP-sulfoquinovose synthase